MDGDYTIKNQGRFIRIFDPHGNEVKNVREITFHQRGMECPTITLELFDTKVEIEDGWRIVRQSVTTLELERSPVKPNAQ